MAINKQQQAWLGVYADLPNTYITFFTRRITRGKIPYVTNALTLTYEEIKAHAIRAKILQRGEKFPVAKLNGSVIKAVTPEVIKDAIPFFAGDSLNRQPGQEIFVNGKKIDNATYERDRRIAALKGSIVTVQEEISAGVFLEGKYVSPDTQNEVTYTPYTDEIVAIGAIKDWAIFTTEKINEFTKNKKARVDEVLVGKDVFYAILASYNKSSNKVIPASAKRVQTSDGDYELHLEAFGFTYVMIPDATNTAGDEIATNNWFMLRSDLAVIPAFAGVVNVDNGASTMEATDVLIRETPADTETGEAKTLGESAYCPIVVNPSLVNIIKITF